MQTQCRPNVEPPGISVLPSPLAWPGTHHARAGEGHLAPIRPPLVLGTILVGKGPLEDLPDVLHVVQADCKALEHSTAEGRQGQSGQGGLALWAGRRVTVPAVSRNRKTRPPGQR